MQIKDKNLKQLTKFLPSGWKTEIRARANVSNQTLNKFLNGGELRYSKGKAIREQISLLYQELKTEETLLLKEIMGK